MRKLWLAAAMACAIGLGGCAQTRAVFDAVTTSVTNPVSASEIYSAENVYAAALTAADQYRAYCWARPYAELMKDPIAKPVCQSRRQIARAIIDNSPKVALAIEEAKAFVRDNPTINAQAAIAAMWGAVNKFKTAVPALR